MLVFVYTFVDLDTNIHAKLIFFTSLQSCVIKITYATKKCWDKYLEIKTAQRLTRL